MAAAANAGLDAATGEHIVFLDGDDWLLPHAVAGALDLARRTGANMVMTDFREYWPDRAHYAEFPEREGWERLARAGDDPEAQRAAVLRMAPMPWRRILRRDFLERHAIRFPVSDAMFEDNPFHWRVTMAAGSIAWHREVTHVHRMARAGQTIARASGALGVLRHFPAMAEAARAAPDAAASADALAALARWLIHHILWCARRTPAAQLPQLYRLARLHAAELDDAAWQAGLEEESPDKARDVRLICAVREGTLLDFLREFD